MNRPRAADDFATIKGRMEELRREREGAEAADSARQRDVPMPRGRSIRWPLLESTEGQAGSANLDQVLRSERDRPWYARRQ